MAQDFNLVCTGWWWIQRWLGQLHEKLHLDAKKTWQCLKVASAKPLVGEKTSLKLIWNLNLTKSCHYLQGIVQGNRDEIKNILQSVTHKLFCFNNKVFSKSNNNRIPLNKPKALEYVDFDKVEYTPPQRKAKVKLHRSRIIFLGQWHHRDCKKCQALQERWRGNPIREWGIHEMQKINSQA